MKQYSLYSEDIIDEKIYNYLYFFRKHVLLSKGSFNISDYLCQFFPIDIDMVYGNVIIMTNWKIK